MQITLFFCLFYSKKNSFQEVFVVSFTCDACSTYYSTIKSTIYSAIMEKTKNKKNNTKGASTTDWVWMEMSHRGPPSGASLFVFLCGNPEGGIIPVFPHAWGFPGLCHSFDLLKRLQGGKQWEFLKYRCSYLRQWPAPVSDMHSYRLALLSVLSQVSL